MAGVRRRGFYPLRLSTITYTLATYATSLSGLRGISSVYLLCAILNAGSLLPGSPDIGKLLCLRRLLPCWNTSRSLALALFACGHRGASAAFAVQARWLVSLG